MCINFHSLPSVFWISYLRNGFLQFETGFCESVFQFKSEHDPFSQLESGNKAAEKFNLCFLIHTYVPCFQIPSYFTVKGRMCCASKTV